MVQKIGSLLAVLLVLGSAIASPQVTLRVADRNGNQIKNLGVKTPFFVSIEVLGESAEISDLGIQTEPHLTLNSAGTSSSVRTVNGATTVKKIYRFQTQVQEHGTYKIGPAYIEKDGDRFYSNTLTFETSEQQKIVDYEEQDLAFLKMSTSSQRVYKGEKLSFNLRFYHLEGARLENIKEPDFKDCTVSKLHGPVNGTETINGTVYRYLEWTGTVHPHKVGTLVIPPVGSLITLQDRNNQNASLDIFDQMFGGSGLRRKEIYSNSLRLEVLNLPDHDPPVEAIGKFSKLNAKINVEKATEGEGIVYTLELLGDGNFSMINHIPLELPKGLKYYDSNMKFKHLGAKVYKKDFEYVVQGLEPGSYTIEPQTFTYFDTQYKQYKTLSTNPIAITIAPGVDTVIPKEPENPTLTPEEKSEVLSVEQTTRWRAKVSRQIPWRFFFFLTLFPLVLIFLLIFWRWFAAYKVRSMPHYGYKNAFKNARIEIQKAVKNKRPEDLYRVCVQLFALRLQLPVSEISESRIEKVLQKNGMQQDDLIAWKNFFTTLTAISFGSKKIVDSGAVSQELLQWLDRFERIV
jgi:hypothetical protein